MTGNIAFGTTALRIEDAAIFGVGRQDSARLFARRVLALPEVRSMTIEPAPGVATIAYRIAPAERRAFFSRLAEAVGSATQPLEESELPSWTEGETVTLSRSGDSITTLRVIESRPGRLRVAHPALGDDGAVARRTAAVLRSLPGILKATAATGTLKVRFDPESVNGRSLVRAIETTLSAPPGVPRVREPEPVPFGVANTTVGLGTVGELMLPLATPVAAGILVVTHLGVVRDAAVQLSRGKVGVPVFHTALLACSIVTGQVLAYALTDWSLRYWQRRWRKNVAKETQGLLDETLPLVATVCLKTAEGIETVVPLGGVRSGDILLVASSDPIPVDGRVVVGDALVDETTVRGARGPVRKTIADEVHAGSTVLVGALEVEVLRTGGETAAAQIAHTFVDVATVFPRDRGLHKKAEQLAERTVIPTLATAGMGWMAGDLITVGAILHQDWISGPVMGVPMQTLRDLRLALHRGALVRSGTAIQRLAESDFVVLDGDDPLLAAPALELAELQSRLPDADTVLRHIAGAGLFLGDERSAALADACRERGLVIRQPVLTALGPGQLEARIGEHTIRLTDGPSDGPGPAPGLQVEVDGSEVARLRFRHGQRLRAADAILRLRAAGLQTFVVSSRSETQANRLARVLGTDLSGGDLDAGGKIRFLHALRRRGVRPTYVGNLRTHPDIAPEAHVSVTLGGLNGTAAVGDVVLLGDSIDALADLVELSRGHEPDIVSASRMATIPNLLCIAGAFAGLLNGITAGIIANIGVMNVDRHLRRSLNAAAIPSKCRVG